MESEETQSEKLKDMQSELRPSVQEDLQHGIQQSGGAGVAKPIWPFKTSESLAKALAVLEDRYAVGVQKERIIERLLKTDKTLLEPIIPNLLELFKQNPLALRHTWVGHFEAMCQIGVDFTEYLPEISHYIRDSNFHFREAVGSFLCRRGVVIATCYKDINWCLAHKNDEIQSLGIRLSKVLGDTIPSSTQVCLAKLEPRGDEIHDKPSSVNTSASTLANNITCEPLRGKRVVVVSENKSMSTLLGKILRHFNATVDFCADTTEGLKTVRRSRGTADPCHMVVVDATAPEVLLKHLKQERGRENLGVLVLSKPLEGPGVRNLAQHGIEGLLIKPFGIHDLATALAGVCMTVEQRV